MEGKKLLPTSPMRSYNPPRKVKKITDPGIILLLSRDVYELVGPECV